MIVPSRKFLMWMGGAAAAILIIVTLTPAPAGVWALILGILAAAALIDVALSAGRLDGVEVEATGVIRLTKDRAGRIELRVRNESGHQRLLRVGLPLPPEIESPDETIETMLAAGAKVSRLTAQCTPRQRGIFLMRRCYIEGPSMLGLWDVRAERTLNCEARVYPNLMGERRNIAALFLNRGGVGVHAVRQMGKGRDFEQLRDYIPGDSYDEVHWKATAKRGAPVTKIFQIERTQEVYVVIDASRLSARLVPNPLVKAGMPVDGAPAAEVSILERFLTAALVLGLAAERQGDLFGLCTFSDRVQKFVRAKNGRAHFNVCRDALYTLQPRTVTPDFDELFTFLKMRLRRRALLLFLTNLDDPVHAEAFERNIGILARQHLVMATMITPPGVEPLFSHGSVASVGDVYERLAGHLQWRTLTELDHSLRRHGSRFTHAANEALVPSLVTQYINVKQRQIL